MIAITELTKDVELVSILRKNPSLSEEKKVFDTLYNKYFSSLYSKHIDDFDDKQILIDLINDSFAKIKEKINLFDVKKGNFSGWFFALAKNLIIDEKRKLSRVLNNEEYKEVELSEYVDSIRTIEFDLFRKEKREILLKMLSQLRNSNLVDIVKMRYFEELSYEEISKKTNKPVGSIKAYLYTAKSCLSEIAKNNKEINDSREE